MTDTTVEILRKARDHIAKPGMWWQGGYSANGYYGAVKGEPCCALGAVGWAAGGAPPAKALALLFEAARPFGADDFNDAPGRTQAEVVALFDRAIELAEREASHD